ncbi:transcriptional regulator [Methylacidiphilum sp. Yel]|jgi:DNA-binding response OmpR family regulator|uniref:winged helix-turn-helix domain-containing protein n=1 Tax=Methylacidiphilum sp. Yel TaxID=1847730 RepID=UPI00106D7C66|nr:winged helix-turn-helix domain-containing protein [Methylacidiphilum sp. Yel]TFE65534.1 transcriptional regulator [Methylacidiphilum sp. Yel]
MIFILATSNETYIRSVEEASRLLNSQLITVNHLSEFFVQLIFKTYDAAIIDPKTPSNFPYLEIVEKLRSEGILLPILLIDIDLNAQKRIIALRKGIEVFIPKDFSPEELAEHLQILIRKKKPEKHILKTGNLTVDLKNSKVWKGTKEIKLTPKEFSLLALLLTKRNNIVSTEEIGEQIWGNSSKINSMRNVIQVHMCGLRKKLEKNALKNFITTIRGKGWIIRDIL